MSLTEISFPTLVKKQVRFKLKAYVGVFSSLVLLQIIAIVFSLNGVSMSGSGSEHFSVTTTDYSANIVIAFTFLWGFMTGILLTTKAYRNDDFSFVTNRQSSSLSTILFLLIASIVAGLSAMLSSYLLNILVYFFVTALSAEAVTISLSEWIIGVVATILYVILFSSIGYFIGSVVQLHRMFTIIIPALIFGLLFFGDQLGVGTLIVAFNTFLFSEVSFLVFTAKVILLSCVLFGSSILLFTRLEVRR